VPTSVRGDARVDILIQIAPGQSPITKNAARVLEHSVECSLIKIENVADFEVSKGQRIRIWPAHGVTEKDIEIFLLGPVWATLCHQRGMLPLHASAIVTGERIAAFAGYSGAGKSTIAASLASLDYELVTDDILPVSFNQNSIPGAWPYLRRLKLRRDSFIPLALTPTEPVSETLDKEKYFVHPKFAADDKWSQLERLYVLELDPTVSHLSVDRITGAEAVRALIDQTYHFSFIVGSGRVRDHVAFCTQLASKIAVYHLRRSPSFGTGKELASLIDAHLENTPI
jgi:hypothetical protein